MKRKRSLIIPQQDSTINKTESVSVNGINGCKSSKSKSIDIPPLIRSDDMGSTISELPTRCVYNIEDTNFKTKPEIKKRRSAKTFPPKCSFTDKYNLSDSIGTSSEYIDDNSLLSNNHNDFINTTDRRISVKRKLDIRYEK